MAHRRAGARAFDQGAAHGVVRVGVASGLGEEPPLAPVAAEAHRGPVVHASRAGGERVRPHAADRIVGGGRARGRSRAAGCLVRGGVHDVAPSIGCGKAKPSSYWKVKRSSDGGRIVSLRPTSAGAPGAGRPRRRPGLAWSRGAGERRRSGRWCRESVPGVSRTGFPPAPRRRREAPGVRMPGGSCRMPGRCGRPLYCGAPVRSRPCRPSCPGRPRRPRRPRRPSCPRRPRRGWGNRS